ncbi:MAG: tRNA pseudouridine(38-40) synthase TruA [Clostridiales bacterium]|nr:tRNA pseudouridine(38-40) synthase TruA [Clostridiales bacterium]
MANILLKIAYDGSAFHGWQRQPADRTVQGVLEDALGGLLGGPAQLDGTSRTDAGVHALGQRATLRAGREGGGGRIPVDRIPLAVNPKLPPDVVVLEAEEMPEGFHARFSATAKTYVYRFAVLSPQALHSPHRALDSAPHPSQLFLRNYAYILKRPLNTSMMSEAAERLVGTHDFACFQAAGGTPRETTVRTVFGTDVRERTAVDVAGNEYGAIEFEVTGDGFLYNMVRIMAGTLAEIGLGGAEGAPAETMDRVIASCDRAFAGPTAPPQGLYLKEVFFREMG